MRRIICAKVTIVGKKLFRRLEHINQEGLLLLAPKGSGLRWRQSEVAESCL